MRAEGYIELAARLTFETPSAFNVRDEFGQSAGALTGKTSASGHVWAGAGDADDWAVETTGKTARRSVVFADADINTGRYVVLGPNQAAVAVQADLKRGSLGLSSSGNEQRFGVLARFNDVNNWLMAVFNSSYDDGAAGWAYWVKLLKRVGGGTPTPIGKARWTGAAGFYEASNTPRLQVDTAGRAYVWSAATAASGRPTSPLIAVSDSALATGGALATGKSGLYAAANVTQPAVDADNFFSFTPAPDAAIFAGRDLELRHDRARRENSDGSGWSPVSNGGRGHFLRIPAGSRPGMTGRMIVGAYRNDPATMPDPGPVDIQAQLFITERGLVVPS